MSCRFTPSTPLFFIMLFYSYVVFASAQVDSTTDEADALENKTFCYSGGLRNDYSCEHIESEDDSFYAFQLLLDDTTAALTPSLTDTIFYQTALPGGRRFVYFGQYSDLDDAMSAAESWRAFLIRHKESMRPMIVEFSYAEPLPRIRLAQTLFDEPEDYEAMAAVVTKVNSNADTIASESIETDSMATVSAAINVVSEPSKGSDAINSESQRQYNDAGTKNNNNHYYELLHTVQLASFKGPNDRRDFYRRYPNADLYCRQNSRGLYTVSLGVFNNYNAAKKQLENAEQFSHLGAYVVTMRDVVMAPCR